MTRRIKPSQSQEFRVHTDQVSIAERDGAVNIPLGVTRVQSQESPPPAHEESQEPETGLPPMTRRQKAGLLAVGAACVAAIIHMGPAPLPGQPMNHGDVPQHAPPSR